MLKKLQIGESKMEFLTYVTVGKIFYYDKLLCVFFSTDLNSASILTFLILKIIFCSYFGTFH